MFGIFKFSIDKLQSSNQDDQKGYSHKDPAYASCIELELWLLDYESYYYRHIDGYTKLTEGKYTCT